MILHVFLEGTFSFIILKKILAFEIQIFAVMSARLIEFFLHIVSQITDFARIKASLLINLLDTYYKLKMIILTLF